MGQDCQGVDKMFQRLIRRLYKKFLQYVEYRPKIEDIQHLGPMVLKTNIYKKGYPWQSDYNRKTKTKKFKIEIDDEAERKLNRAKTDLVDAVLGITDKYDN